MTGVPSNTAIVVDTDVSGVGIDVDALVAALRGLGTGRTTVVPGLARHPELLTREVRASAARRVVVVTAEFERPPISELAMWGEAGGASPLGVHGVALDILRARRSADERLTYAVRMVRAAVAALDAARAPEAVRRSVGGSLTRRGLFSARATTWVPVVGVDALACLGMPQCGRCVQACPENALLSQGDISGAPPVLDASRCGACSACLDVCPSGALSLDGHDSGTLVRQMRALLHSGDGSPAPSLVIACRSAAEPLHHLGEREGIPGWLALELACFGGVGSAWHLAALAAGARTVQLLPCERCMDRGSLTKQLAFTRRLLTALGDVDAARRAGVLPVGGARLRRAILAADGLTPLVAGTTLDLMPPPGAIETSARVAAWAVGVLETAMGGTGQGRQPQPRVVEGPGAPLGAVRAGEGCTACGVCARCCPTQALSMRAAPGGTDLLLDPSSCNGCGVCAETCPEAVLAVVPGVDLDLLAGGSVPIAHATAAICPDCGASVPALPTTASPTALPAGLATRCPRCRQAFLVASV